MNKVHTPQKTQCAIITKTNSFMLFTDKQVFIAKIRKHKYSVDKMLKFDLLMLEQMLHMAVTVLQRVSTFHNNGFLCCDNEHASGKQNELIWI